MSNKIACLNEVGKARINAVLSSSAFVVANAVVVAPGVAAVVVVA